MLRFEGKQKCVLLRTYLAGFRPQPEPMFYISFNIVYHRQWTIPLRVLFSVWTPIITDDENTTLLEISVLQVFFTNTYNKSIP
jgi:hypothetical protein